MSNLTNGTYDAPICTVCASGLCSALEPCQRPSCSCATCSSFRQIAGAAFRERLRSAKAAVDINRELSPPTAPCIIRTKPEEDE